MFKEKLRSMLKIQEKRLQNGLKNGLKIFTKVYNFKGFSLVELMISLIVISLIMAAFVPVISKKLTTGSIFAGSSGGGFGKSCSEIDEDCDLCAGSICLSCKKTCPAGETLNTTSCSCETKVPYSMAVEGLYVTRFNMGDSSKTKIPAEAGVTVVKTGETCGSATDYSSKCCWQGETSGYCGSTNEDYSGCKRTVCNWAAANAICANYKQDGKTWRLPTTSEMENWATYSKGKGNDGLMLCDRLSGYSSARCDNSSSNSCPGSYRGSCHSLNVWSGSIGSSTNAYKYFLSQGDWGKSTDYRTSPFSVRCVSDIALNCKTYLGDGETCIACKTGYYLSGKECKKTTEVENCETYSKTENKCETCKDGYELKNGKCKSSFYMAVDNLYVAKYNMGDSADTAIPISAGVNVVLARMSCGSKNDYSTKCCWQGGTSGSNCDAANGDYSGCNRTVCNWAAANAICANYKQGGKTWRLPMIYEMENWKAYSINKGNNGLMLCDYHWGYSSAYCDNSNNCPGSPTGICYPHNVWSGSILISTDAYYYYLDSGSWRDPSITSRTFAFSVRCVSEIVPNCEIVSGNTCIACKTGYYLSGKECKKSTEVQNCATYSATEDKCKSCSSGYKLSNNKCVSDFCSGSNFLKIGSLCVTKYNMGDNADTAIPTSAGVTVVSVGHTCGSSSNYSAKCCWQGSTSGFACDDTNGDYSGCNRTVCNWAAANAICANYTKGGKTWYLPTISEMTYWTSYSKGKGSDGLMLCDSLSGNSSAYCANSKSCPGSSNGYCYPNGVWSSSLPNYDDIYAQNRNLSNGSWGFLNNNRTDAFSVRCVAEM